LEFGLEPREDSANEAQVEKPNKKEMQAVKYVNGGTIVKKNLFSSWLNIYENEANFYGYQTGIRALPP
jgi:WD40 repeat protein